MVRFRTKSGHQGQGYEIDIPANLLNNIKRGKFGDSEKAVRENSKIKKFRIEVDLWGLRISLSVF